MKLLNHSKFWLLGIATALTLLQLQLTWLSRHNELLEPSVLCWAAVWFSLWRRHASLKLRSGMVSTVLGMLVIAWVLVRSASVSGYDSFLRVSPIGSALGLALFASDLKGLKRYWREFLILSFVMIPMTSVMSLVDISPLTAKFASTLLWHLGFSVTQQSVNISLPTGTVEVYEGCSGITFIVQSLTLAFLLLMLFVTNPIQKLFIPLLGVVIAFVVNGIRVALMTVLFASYNLALFDYWHVGYGSQIFSMISIALFGLSCYFMISPTDPSDEAYGAES